MSDLSWHIFFVSKRQLGKFALFLTATKKSSNDGVTSLCLKSLINNHDVK